ncbi:MAG: thioredoxin family protein [Capsulimonadaceae bacterium]
MKLYRDGTYVQTISGPNHSHVVNVGHWTYGQAPAASDQPGPWMVLDKTILPWKWLAAGSAKARAQRTNLLISADGFNGNYNMSASISAPNVSEAAGAGDGPVLADDGGGVPDSGRVPSTGGGVRVASAEGNDAGAPVSAPITSWAYAPSVHESNATPPSPSPQAESELRNPGGIPWNSDLQTAVEYSRANHRLMMVDVYTDWCEWCKKLDSDVYTDPSIIREARNFIPLKLNAETSPGGPQFAKEHSVDGYPTIIFMDADGREVNRIGGYESVSGFLSDMQSAEQGASN